MGGAIPTGAAGGRSPNPDHGHHGRCRCRWRAARRKDMRLRTGGSACEREREQRYAESRDHVRSTCRARGAGGRHTTHAHGRAFDPGAPRPQPYRGERRVPLFSPACVPDLFNCELALSGSGSSYNCTLASAGYFHVHAARAARSFFIGGRRRNSDDAARAAPIRGAVAVSSFAVGWPDRSFRQLLSTQSGLRDQ